MTFSFGEIRMAFDFVDERLPEEYSLVRDIFADTENARGRFREMLESSGALRERLEFETSRVTKVLGDWCEARGIVFEE